jgi:predicted nucleic acid-binding protein
MDALVALLDSSALIVVPDAGVRGVATHPEDDVVLATGVSAGADFLVTGDRKLLQLGTYRGVRITTCTSFLEALADAAQAPGA